MTNCQAEKWKIVAYDGMCLYCGHYHAEDKPCCPSCLYANGKRAGISECIRRVYNLMHEMAQERGAEQ